jgi:DGQHR domain-containing protein
MKKIPLYPVHQKSHTFFAMIADPRDIAAVMKRAKAAESQENQRPWSKSKVKEIARFVMGWMRIGANTHSVMGLLPNAPIISFSDNLTIEHDPSTDSYYVLFPETIVEFAQYEDSIEVIDGQHRVLAFADDLRDPDFSDSTRYEMIFSVFQPLGMSEKKEIFMITNEKQTKVESNLLRLFKKQLQLLDDDERLFDLVNRLHTEDYSPLKGRVIIGSDNITKGYKEGQLSKILDKSGIYDKLARTTGDDEQKMCKGLSIYLQAWESVYQVSFKNPGKETLTKISGLRYILYLFSDMLDILKDQNKLATKANLEELIRLLPAATGIVDVFTSNETALAFRGEGATVKMAKDHGKVLVNYTKSMNSATNPADVW